MKTITNISKTSKSILKSISELVVTNDPSLVAKATEAAYLLGRSDESNDSIKRIAALKHKINLKNSKSAKQLEL